MKKARSILLIAVASLWISSVAMAGDWGNGFPAAKFFKSWTAYPKRVCGDVEIKFVEAKEQTPAYLEIQSQEKKINARLYDISEDVGYQFGEFGWTYRMENRNTRDVETYTYRAHVTGFDQFPSANYSDRPDPQPNAPYRLYFDATAYLDDPNWGTVVLIGSKWVKKKGQWEKEKLFELPIAGWCRAL